MIRVLTRRHLLALALVVVMVVFVSAPAGAGGIVSCGGGGHLYTFGKSTISQIHEITWFEPTEDLGPGTFQVYWGFRSSTYQWDVYGSGVYYEAAHCPV